ncbi:MAG: FtsQ-type POTRA domain-containing protein [Deltaproteobacteria bacterium]|nr:FtsQ-type POTRA domain-containing protein [Deltaproteobacteria bacterium]
MRHLARGRTAGARRRRSRRTTNIPWRRIGLIGGLTVCTAGMVATMRWAVPRVWTATKSHAYFALTEVTVRGNSRWGREQLLQSAGLRPGMSIWDANPSAIRLRLRLHADLADVRVRRDFPHRLVVSVRERVPAAIAVLDDLYFVDRSGQLMNRLREDDSRDLPLITGLGITPANREDVLMLRRAARMIRLCQREGCGAGLSEVNIDPRRGVTLIPLRQPVPIVVGWGNWRTKLARTKRVLAAWEGQESRVALFDATFSDQVVVRLRPSPIKTRTTPRSGAKSGMRA